MKLINKLSDRLSLIESLSCSPIFLLGSIFFYRTVSYLPKMGRGGYRQINKTLNICAFEDYLDTQVARLPRLNNVEQITTRVLRVLGQNEGKVGHLGILGVVPYIVELQVDDKWLTVKLSLPYKEQIHISSVQAPSDSLSIPARVFRNGPT